jgi:hypothetical protein
MDGKAREGTHEGLRTIGTPRDGVVVHYGDRQLEYDLVEHSACALSADEKYRYVLIRQWNLKKPCALWVMLNPSTATHTEDDATIRKCRGFSRRWGLGGMVVVNLFAFRTTYPRHLVETTDPVGPANDATIIEQAAHAERIVCAWGTHGVLHNRSETVLSFIQDRKRRDTPILCLGKTQAGMPKHPLHIAYATELESFG